MSRRDALTAGVARVPARRFAGIERRVRCEWCLWEATAADVEAEMRLRVMRRAHVETYHPDSVPS